MQTYILGAIFQPTKLESNFSSLNHSKQLYVEVAITSLNVGQMSPQIVRVGQQGDPVRSRGMYVMW